MDKRKAIRIVHAALNPTERVIINWAVNDAWATIGADILAGDRGMANERIVEYILDGGHNIEPHFEDKELFKRFRAIEFAASCKWLATVNNFGA